ncbi:MAG: S41 family peptidase [Desulfobacterales bacterium]|nr:S41 family peptidase [Desulfobacterales bacterium]
MRVKNRPLKICLVIGVAVLFWAIGSNVYRDNLANGEETYKGLKLFTDVIELIEKNYVDEVDTEKLMQKAIQGMVRSLDPHSSFLPPEAFEELQVDTHGEFGGIGIVITVKDGILTVVSPIEGTPAYKAGIQAGDKIIKVDDESTQEMELWEAVKKMRGKQGSKVVITIMREKEPEPIDFVLIRDIIPIESVKSLMLRPGYGYIWVTNFRDNTTDDIIKAVKAFEKQPDPLKGLILDLRDNPGGLLNQAITTADLFLDKGRIVSIKGRLDKHTKSYEASAKGTFPKFPMVVLINGGSASASEIVAGALQDNKRALILGTVSFGKGSVQTVEALRDGYGLKYTIALYYTPNDVSIQAQGIEPDVLVKQRWLDENETQADETGLKEKDLENHLEVVPEGMDKKEKLPEGEPQKPEKPMMRNPEFRHGPLSLDTLKDDNQVMRALEILVGYELFKNYDK